MRDKKYLGDSIWIEVISIKESCSGLVLTTIDEEGICANRIYFKPDIADKLITYLYKRKEEGNL